MKTAAEYRKIANEYKSKENESFSRCDTDGCITQKVHSLNFKLNETLAEIVDSNGMAQFLRLLDDKGVVVSDRKITTRYGVVWVLSEDGEKKFGRKFVPVDSSYSYYDEDNDKFIFVKRISRIQKKLNIHEDYVWRRAWATISHTNTGGLSSIVDSKVVIFEKK